MSRPTEAHNSDKTPTQPEGGLETSSASDHAEQDARTLRSRRPQLVVVEDLQGELRPHSIMSLDAASAFVIELASRLDVRGYVLSLDYPRNAWLTDPFDNLVALHIAENGDMAAYGRFGNTSEAGAFRLGGAPLAPNSRIIVASVNSSFLQ